MNFEYFEFLCVARRFADNIYFQHTNGNLEYGIDKIEKRVIQLMDYLIESLSSIPNIAFLTPLEPEYRSSIVNVKVANNIEIAKKLRERHIITSSRYGGIRISPHFYNTEDDLDLLVITLKELIN